MRCGDLRMGVIVAAMALAACSERAPTGAGVQAPPLGAGEPAEQRHDVVFTDLRGERVAEGELALPESPEGEFEGRWALTPIAEEVTLPIGSGQISGRRNEDDIWLVLKPDAVDHSIEALVSTRPEFHGIWYLTTDAGPEARGYIVTPASEAELAPVAVKLASADELIAAGEAHQALFVLEEIIADHPESPAYVLALQREVEIGAEALRGPAEVEGGAGHVEGVEIMIRAVERLPRSATAARAMSELGEYFERIGDTESAMIVYERMLLHGVTGEARDEAVRRLEALIER